MTNAAEQERAAIVAWLLSGGPYAPLGALAQPQWRNFVHSLP